MNRRHIKGQINQAVLSDSHKYRNKNIDVFSNNNLAQNKMNQKVYYQEPSESSQER